MKNIYFLHIPKTAGTFINSTIVKELNKNNITNYASNSRNFPHIIDFKNTQYISGHFGTYPITQSSYIDFFTMLRNPLDLSVSYFNFLYNNKYDSIYSNVIGYKNKLIKYLFHDNNTKIYNNIQSRFLSNSAKNYIFYPNNKSREDIEKDISSENFMWFVDDENTSFENAVKTINSCSFIGSVENIEDFCIKLKQYFLLNLEIDINFDTNKKINSSVAVDGLNTYSTNDAIGMLSKDDIEMFVSNNKIDYMVYSYAIRHNLI